MVIPDRIEALLNRGVVDRIYPGAVLLVSKGGMIQLFHNVGSRMLEPYSLPMEKDTLFDLASLTKPLATTLAMMKLMDAGTIVLDRPIETLLQRPVPKDKKRITPRLLLSHCAGCIDWKPFYLDLDHVAPKERKALLRERLLDLPLAYAPGTQARYSDIGFMLIEWVIDTLTGVDLPRFLAREFFAPLSLKEMHFFSSHTSDRLDPGRFAATEDCPWRKRVVQGDVHDENAYVLGGYSGHAGLFGTARAVYTLTNLLREHWRGEREDCLRPETVRAFFTRQDIVEGSTWALGWDTPSPQDSSAGRWVSKRSVGHLGFTGTSVWMDLEQDVIIIFLTNRIHPTRKNEKIRAFRPLLHDHVMEALGLGG